MPKILVVLTDNAEAAGDSIQQSSGTRVETVDLREADPDYNTLLDKIFEADSVQIW